MNGINNERLKAAKLKELVDSEKETERLALEAAIIQEFVEVIEKMFSTKTISMKIPSSYELNSHQPGVAQWLKDMGYTITRSYYTGEYYLKVDEKAVE